LKHDLLAVQLHGKESVAFVALRNQLQKTSKSKVFSIQDEFDFSILEPFSCSRLFPLILRKLPRKRNNFRLKVLENYPSTKPFFSKWCIGPED
jgi:phosphoribosylanthranilate isomerase